MATDTDKFQSYGEIESNRENNTKYFPLTAFDENGLVGFFTVRTPGDDDKKVGFGFSVIWGTNEKGEAYLQRNVGKNDFFFYV